MMQSGYTVKRYNEVPKTITLTRRSHFSIEVFADRSYGFIGFVNPRSFKSCAGAELPEQCRTHDPQRAQTGSASKFRIEDCSHHSLTPFFQGEV